MNGLFDPMKYFLILWVFFVKKFLWFVKIKIEKLKKQEV